MQVSMFLIGNINIRNYGGGYGYGGVRFEILLSVGVAVGAGIIVAVGGCVVADGIVGLVIGIGW
jgi:hypothetical protein